jgi:hypothetical protein
VARYRAPRHHPTYHHQHGVQSSCTRRDTRTHACAAHTHTPLTVCRFGFILLCSGSPPSYQVSVPLLVLSTLAEQHPLSAKARSKHRASAPPPKSGAVVNVLLLLLLCCCCCCRW